MERVLPETGRKLYLRGNEVLLVEGCQGEVDRSWTDWNFLVPLLLRECMQILRREEFQDRK